MPHREQTNLDNSSDIYLIVYGMIRSDRLIIQGLRVVDQIVGCIV